MPSCANMGYLEKGHYENAPDVDANAASLSMDFVGMLDSADSVLHQQIYEFFQGPSVAQELPLSSSQEGCFTIPVYPGSAPFEPPSPFLSMQFSAEPLQANTSHFVEHRIRSDSILHLTREGAAQVANYVDHHTDISRRIKHFKSMGSAAPAQMVPTSLVLGSDHLPPPQLYSTDHTFGRVFQAPANPSLVHGTSDSPYNPRECSGYEASCSLNSLKRAGCDFIISPQSRSRGCKALKMEARQDVKKTATTRPTEQSEHIKRERQRRDDMTSKFAMLESLLPPGPKRDRSTIVDDSIQHVKNLYHRVKELQQKRSEMKSNRSASVSGAQMMQDMTMRLKQEKENPVLQGSDQKKLVQESAGNKKDSVVLGPASLKAVTLSFHSESNASMDVQKTCIEKLEVHLDLPHEMVIEMTCRPHAHIQSQILDALERLGLDVSRCSITKLLCRIICIIVVKPRVVTDIPAVTGDDVIRALKCALVPDL